MPRSFLDKCFVCGGSPVVAAGVICDSPICQRGLVAFLDGASSEGLKSREDELNSTEELLNELIQEAEETFDQVSSVEEWKLLVEEFNSVSARIFDVCKKITEVEELQRRLSKIKDRLN